MCLFATDVCKVSFSTAANLSELMAAATELKSASRILAVRSVFSAFSTALNLPMLPMTNPARLRTCFSVRSGNQLLEIAVVKEKEELRERGMEMR